MSERVKCCLCGKGRSSVQNFSPKEKKKEKRQGGLKKDKKERRDKAVLSPWMKDEGL